MRHAGEPRLRALATVKHHAVILEGVETAAQNHRRSNDPFEVKLGRAVAAPRGRIGMTGDAVVENGRRHGKHGELQRRRDQPGREHAAAVMMMRDRSVIVSLRQPIVRVMGVTRLVGIAMRVRGAAIVGVIGHLLQIVVVAVPVMPVRMVRGRLNIMIVIAMHDSQMVVVFVSLLGHVLHVDRQVVAVIEDGAGERRRRMLDLEDVLHPVEHDDRHLDRQCQTQPDAA